MESVHFQKSHSLIEIGNMGDRFESVAEAFRDTQDLSYPWCAGIRIPHKNSVLPLDRKSCALSSSLYIELQVLTNLHTQ